jgi:glycosyltransferase involved in cell wall biosynthesis|tara:strand:- start:8428 stop:9519 length:1092 start_codon:yes stop_codon:yes gene_type:complete
MKNIIINLINANQGAHIVRSKNFLLNLKKIDLQNNYLILTEKKIDILTKNFNYIIFNISKYKFFAIIQRFIIQNFFINYYYFRYNISVYINFSHTIPILSLKKILKIIAVTNVAPFVTFKKFSNIQKIKMFYLKYKILYNCLISDKIISISGYCKELLEKNSISSKKIHIISNGINDNVKINLNLKSKNFFLYVSHFYSYKNFENLIISYSNLPAKIQNKFKLVLIGNPYDLKYYESIKNLIFNLKLEHNVKIYSNLTREQINDYIKKCYLFIFPSLIENCPMSLLEAMEFNKPILTSNISPMNEFCKDLPIYFNPHDQNSIVNSITKFCNNNELSFSYDYSLIKKELTWKKFTKKILLMYKI